MPARIPSAIRTADTRVASLLLSDGLTILSDMVGYVTLPWWIAHEGGAHDLAIYSASVAVAVIVAMPLLAPLGDRYAKRPQIVWGLCASMATAFSFAALASASGYRLADIVGIGVFAVVAKAFAEPASAAISAELVPVQRLAQTLRLRKSAQAGGRAVGPALAGAAMTFGGIAATLWLNGALLGVAAWAASRLPVQEPSARHGEPRRGFHRWRADLRAGLRAKWAIPLERGWTVVNFLVWIFEGPALGMLIPLKVQSLGLSGAWLGACEAALSVGYLVGTLHGSGALVRRFGRFTVRVGAAACEGLALAAAGYAHTPALLIVAIASAGFMNASMGLVGATHRSLAIPLRFRVRLRAAGVMTTQLAGMLGPLLAGVALARWSVAGVYTGFGLATFVLAFGFVLIPRSREFFALDHEQVADWFEREYPDAFRASAAVPERSTT